MQRYHCADTWILREGRIVHTGVTEVSCVITSNTRLLKCRSACGWGWWGTAGRWRDFIAKLKDFPFAVLQEPHMEVINPFLQDNKQRIVLFLDEISVKTVSFIWIMYTSLKLRVAVTAGFRREGAQPSVWSIFFLGVISGAEDAVEFRKQQGFRKWQN